MSRANFQLLQVLRKIRDEGVIDVKVGLCMNIVFASYRSGINSSLGMTFRSISKHWPFANSHLSYPVDGLKEFTTNMNNNTLWNNPRRHELLHWAIMYLENLE